jgi:hypothetical protein
VAAAQHLPGSYVGPADSSGIKATMQLNTACVSSSFFPAALTNGVTLYEPFDGLCAGLEMVLRAGISVKQYLYSDSDMTAQRIAQHRVRLLQTQYPSLLEPEALIGAFCTLPADVRQVSTQHLQQAVQIAPAQQWLVFGGWPCQDLSTAGSSCGMAGSRAQLIHDVVRIIGTLQQLQHHLPPAYLLENVAFQHHPHLQIAAADYERVCSIIGQPVTFDAAKAGSLAHRLRNYWTNLGQPGQLQQALSTMQRPASRSVQIALQPGRVAMPVHCQDQYPQHVCNQPGQPLAAWPMLMGRQASYAFRPGQPGSILDVSNPAAAVWSQPVARGLGFRVWV